MNNINNLNPLVLAFVGDAVYTEKVRTHLVSLEPAKVNDLHKNANKLVCCEYQAYIFEQIKNNLSEIEQNIASRARNAKKNTTPKHAEPAEYNKSTALEAIVGYNYLIENFDRLNQIFEIVLKGKN